MKKITTTHAPQAIGPYSQAIVANNMLFISGQLPLNPNNGEMAGDDIESQTRRVLDNIKAIVEDAGLSMKSIVKTTIFLSDMQNFQLVNTIYSSYFSDPYPARATIEVSKLPKNALIEIEAIAVF